jgi:hypothetical protein
MTWNLLSRRVGFRKLERADDDDQNQCTSTQLPSERCDSN